MSPLLILAIVLASIAAYGFGAGVTWRLLSEDTRLYKYQTEPSEPSVGGIIAAILWPVFLPALLGIRLIARSRRVEVPRATARDRK